MRLKILFIFLLFHGVCSAQNLIAVRQYKDSADGFMPFYDTDEKQIPVMVSLAANVDTSNYDLFYAIKRQSTNSTLAIYDKEILFTKNNFDVNIPINDTLINSGNYNLVFILTSSTGQLIQEVVSPFQTLRNKNSYYQLEALKNRSLLSSKIAESARNVDLKKTFVNKYDLKRIRANILSLSPVSERTEQSVLNSLVASEELENLQRFFYNFWYARNPQNPEAEWKLYAEKLNYCARNYGYGTYKGYQTDMGRLYLRYGPPNRKLTASSERGTRPYEVWFYSELDQFTNLNILFAQLGSQGNERVLMHSNIPAFFFNPHWAQQLFTDPQEQYNKNSHRVYEFFK